MEWPFTPEDVVKGMVGYGLASFRGDLLHEVRLNLPDLDEAARRRLFDLIYDLYYWLATGRSFEEFLGGLELPAHVVGFLGSVRAQSEANVAMLGAILQRAIQDRVEAGLPLEQALEQTAAAHGRALAARPAD